MARQAWGALAFGVFDELGFVEDGVAEVDFVEEGAVATELGVAGEPEGWGVGVGGLFGLLVEG